MRPARWPVIATRNWPELIARFCEITPYQDKYRQTVGELHIA